MMEQEIHEIMAHHQAAELAQALMNHLRHILPLSQDERQVIVRILADVTKDLPVYQTMWVAFWLGCAWQNLRD